MKSMLILLALLGAKQFVITSKLPDVKYSKPKPAGAAACDCHGNVSKCTCDPDACQCAGCSHNTKTEPSAEAKALAEDGVYLDESFLTQAAPLASTATKKTVYLFGPAWCPHCPAFKTKIGPGDEQLTVEYRQQEVLNPSPRAYPAIWNPYTREFYYSDEITSFNALKSRVGVSDPIVGGIPAGKIGSGKLKFVDFLMGKFKGFSGENESFEHKFGSAKIIFPANFGAKWSADGDGVRMTFTDSPRFVWGWVDKKLNFIRRSPSEIEFDIPNLPNPIMKIVDGDGEPTVMALPELAKVSFADDPAAAPTPYSEVYRVLDLLPKPQVAFVDFGCGDGRWCIAASQKWGCRSVGVEIDPARAAAARERVRNAGLSHLVTIIEGDALTADVQGDVAVAYLYPGLLSQLKPRLEKFRAVASYMHNVPGLPMDRNGDSWVYRQTAVAASQPARRGAVWGGVVYSGPVCNSPNCRMCASIRSQMAGF